MPADTTNDIPQDGSAAAPSGRADVPAEAVAPLLRGIAVLRHLTDANDGTLSLSSLEKATGLA
ncbi:hypothetical protein B5181_36105, partial [Streptomyces sp. 4F]